jgi:hypothetical protein
MRVSEVDRERLGIDMVGWGWLLGPPKHFAANGAHGRMDCTVLYCTWEMSRPEEEAGSRREAKERATCMTSNHKYCYAA